MLNSTVALWRYVFLALGSWGESGALDFADERKRTHTCHVFYLRITRLLMQTHELANGSVCDLQSLPSEPDEEIPFMKDNGCMRAGQSVFAWFCGEMRRCESSLSDLTLFPTCISFHRSYLFLPPKSLCRQLLEDREGRQAKRVCLVVCLVALGVVAMPFRPVVVEAPSARVPHCPIFGLFVLR